MNKTANWFSTVAIALIVSIFSFQAQAQSIEGKWKTIDDETNTEKSYIEIRENIYGYYEGEIVQLLNRDAGDENPNCEKCPGDLQNKPVLGLVIVNDMEKKGDEYRGGTILDPKKGKTYTCKMWFEDDDTLKVRGYLGPFYRTQTWYRVN